MAVIRNGLRRSTGARHGCADNRYQRKLHTGLFARGLEFAGPRDNPRSVAGAKYKQRIEHGREFATRLADRARP
jgi:hypothetical protein